MAGQYAQPPGQHLGDGIDLLAQLTVGPHHPAGIADRGTVGAQSPDGGVQQLGAAVEPVGIAQIGQLRPLLAGRQPVARKGVGVGRGP